MHRGLGTCVHFQAVSKLGHFNFTAVIGIHDPQASEKWKKFKRAWTNYALATELNKKPEAVQVATLLTVIGEEAHEVFSTFTDWAANGDDAKIEPVLAKVAQYCQRRMNTTSAHKSRAKRMINTALAALRKLTEGCDFQTITPEEILQDRLVFGIKDDKVRERLLRESNLTLSKTDEICRAAESMIAQMKVVGHMDSLGASVSAVRSHQEHKQSSIDKSHDNKHTRECWNCGRRHEYHQKELCPAYGKICSKCHKPNHFAAKCRGGRNVNTGRSIKAVDDDADEVFQTHVSAVRLDDSQFVTLKLKSGNCLRFQVDTGAQCNVILLALYKKVTNNSKLEHVTPAKTQITAYGGATLPVVGIVLIHVWRGDFRCRLHGLQVSRLHQHSPIVGKESLHWDENCDISGQ